MVLDARHRSSIYGKLVVVLGEDDANALMSAFPGLEADELVTKEILRAELAELRLELGGQITQQGAELRGEMAEQGAELRGEIAVLRGEVHDLLSAQTTRLAMWVVSTMLAGMAMAAAIARGLG